MTPTRIRELIALLLGVAAVAWGALRIAQSRGAALPLLGWTAPAFIVLLAGAVLVVALALRSRRRNARLVNPLGAARMAVLGKASAHVGPVVGGIYLGYLALLVSRLDVADWRSRAVVSAVALLACVALSAAGLLLERLCMVAGGEDDDVPPGASAA